MKTALKQKFVQFAGKAGRVTEVETLSPRVRRIRLAADRLVGQSFVPGDKIKLQANDVLRSYTPSRVNTQEGWLDIIVFLHGQGPAAQWASTVEVGASASFLGPVRSVTPVQDKFDSAMFLGDETTIGLALALVSDHPTVQWHGAIECDPQDARAVQAAGLSFEAVARGTLPRLAQTAPNADRWWLSGEAQTVVQVREQLLGRGVSTDRLKIKPYWSQRGTAHRKQLEKDILRS